MRYASVVVDIPTRGLDRAFDYAVPDALAAQAKVGVTVLAPFSGRDVVGYVVGLSAEPPAEVPVEKILPIKQVLAPSAFDAAGARVALWMAEEYACPLATALHPFLAPGQRTRVVRSDTGEWTLVNEKAGPVDARWVRLSAGASDFTPKKNATKQREVLAALAAGPVRMAELGAMLPGAAASVRALAKRGVVAVEVRRRVRGGEATTLSSAHAARPRALTAGQRAALAAIDRAREAVCGDVVLVDGVTGSGKTEVYLDAIEHARAEGKSALVLVPEISLTAQTVGRFRSRFGDDVAVLHSRLSIGERYDQWDLARRGEAHVVVGARSALFAPVPDLGLIVIDEEHEGTYKQDTAPRYHAREVAAYMARERGCALVLGSATPSLESLERCRVGVFGAARWTRVRMPERPGTSVLPAVRIVDMTKQPKTQQAVFSAPLSVAIEGVVRRREKAVLLLNRRGFASFLMCQDCGCVPECPHCSTALTYHERTHELVCHSCGRRWPGYLTSCPSCGSRYIGAYGIGTQRVEDELGMLLAGLGSAGEGVEVIRMDADTTARKNAHQELLERFDAADCAILLGTQMIAKGLDFPEVTLVGVINADTTLKLPDFRAAERTYDLLEQVAGRAGRGARPGEVIIQSYWAGHPAVACVATHDRDAFAASELAARAEAGYPPYSRLSNVLVWGKDGRAVHACTDRIADGLRAAVGRGWEVVGPADCVKARVKDRFRRHVLVKSPVGSNPGPLIAACVRDAAPPRGVSVSVDVDAQDLM